MYYGEKWGPLERRTEMFMANSTKDYWLIFHHGYKKGKDQGSCIECNTELYLELSTKNTLHM